jgi:hypothetical protein
VQWDNLRVSGLVSPVIQCGLHLSDVVVGAIKELSIIKRLTVSHYMKQGCTQGCGLLNKVCQDGISELGLRNSTMALVPPPQKCSP